MNPTISPSRAPLQSLVSSFNAVSLVSSPLPLSSELNKSIHPKGGLGNGTTSFVGGGGTRKKLISPGKGFREEGGGWGRKDVVRDDWEGVGAGAIPTTTGLGGRGERKSPVKKGKHYDRYIPSRSSSRNGVNEDHTGTFSDTGDTTHTSDLSISLGIDPHKRILSFFAEPPPAVSEHSSLLASYSRLPVKGSTASSSSAPNAATRRRIATAPERVLDAPGLMDDYYLNLLDWSCTNLVAIGLGESVYIWNAESGQVNLLCSVGGENSVEVEGDEYICALRWSEDGAYLSIGLSTGSIQVWDIESTTLLRTMIGHLSRVPSLSWSGAILSSGSRSGEIWNSDVRIGNHRVAELKGHRGEVCGLEWRKEIEGGLSGGGQGLLASGGNDNVVNVWDGRMTSAPKMSKTNHTAAVKALAWCPWTPHLLASGGGSSDRTIHFWNTTTSARLNSLVTPSQVTSLIFNPHSRELLSSHGIPDHQLSIWSYPTLEKVIDIPQAHETRILHSCLSPDGTVVATASSDENLKFWRVFEGRKGKAGGGSRLGGTVEAEEGDGIQKKGRTGISVR